MGRNLVPIVGILFFGWSALGIIVLYFADFLLDIVTCAVLAGLLTPDVKAEAGKLHGIKEWAKATLGVALAAAILLASFIFVFGMPIFFVAGMGGEDVTALWEDSRFAKGLLLHVLISSWAFFEAYRYLAARSREDPGFVVDKAIKGRFDYVMLRWVFVYAAGLFLPFFPLLMVAAFCGATVYAELNPRRFAELFNTPGPIRPDEATLRDERDKLAARARRRRLRKGLH